MTEKREAKHQGVLELANLVEYQDSSVISRTLTKAGKGSITLFAFDKGEALDLHSAPFEALIQVLDGNARVELSGKMYELKAGESLLMPANAPHAVWAVNRFKMLLTLLRA